jgi:hypothetical protein
MKKILEIRSVPCAKSLLHLTESGMFIGSVEMTGPNDLYRTIPQDIVILSSENIQSGDTYIWMNNYQQCKAEGILSDDIINHVINGDIKKVVASYKKGNISTHLQATYISTYSSKKTNNVVVDYNDATGLPLFDKVNDIKASFINVNFDIDDIFDLMKTSYVKGQTTKFEEDSFRKRDSYLQSKLCTYLAQKQND